ncbi:flagellar hook assembly protein FlgD [Pelagibacterium lentulum]|uniref:Basal-body rod modification protein FlgD n=1 Tax=Pelagibacterium lentulum TaxID=2029865 RepID=A0A916RIU4_9HYPH|nr:flagellar hook assembly protein FlgD [Pelagibacterium lentulum]GGA57546.1 flagellar hook assembly protein [Pelagibacterium lentulum]
MVDGVSATSSASGLAGQRKGIADNFDTFLQLLVTQLKNQNPLEPLDTNQFTQQLVQFSSVEQQLKTNEFLEAMMMANQTAVNGHAVQYVGKTVTASGATTELSGGVAAWVYKLDAPAPNSTVTIKDQNGNVVYRQQMSLEAGVDEIVWNGMTDSGNKLTSGKFTITIDARDTDNKYVPVTTELMGKVQSVDLSGSEPYLIISGLRIPLSAITSVGADMPSGDEEKPDPIDPEQAAAA